MVGIGIAIAIAIGFLQTDSESLNLEKETLRPCVLSFCSAPPRLRVKKGSPPRLRVSA